MPHRLRKLNAIVVAALATAGVAAASSDAPQCHPDLPGTHTLSVTGTVTNYRFAAPGTLAVSVRGGGVVRWNDAANASASGRGSSAAGSATAPQKLFAVQGDRLVRVVLAPNGIDRPDRLDVFARATGHRIVSWPLIARPARVALSGGIAILSGADRGALYALRISDGRIAELGIARAGDRPVIGAGGVAYQDGQFLKGTRWTLAPGHVALKFVPLASVERQLSLADREVVTPGRISAIGMDGQRVAFAVHDAAGRCDRVWFGIPPWNFAMPVTQTSGPTCLPTHAAGGITNVAIAGNRLVWTTKYGQTTRVIAQSTIACVEWVVARPARGGAPVAALAGDGNVLAYALRDGTVGLVPSHWQGHVISQSPTRVSAMSVNGKRIATLYRDGTVTVMTTHGAPVSSFAVGAARAVALRGDTLAVLQKGKLALYDATTGALTRSWRVPAGARTIDLAYGIAVIAAGGDAVALNVNTGHTARLLQTGGRVATQIDAAGAIVQFNAGGHGHLRFVPMSTLEARTR